MHLQPLLTPFNGGKEVAPQASHIFFVLTRVLLLCGPCESKSKPETEGIREGPVSCDEHSIQYPLLPL